MTAPDLPAPATAAEMYLAAILAELGDIKGRLPEPPSPTTVDEKPAQVELTEPARPARTSARPARTRTPKTKERHG